MAYGQNPWEGQRQGNPYGMGGAPRPQTPSYPGAGQTGTGYGRPMNGSIGSISGPLPAPNLGYSRNVPTPSLGQGWGQMSGSPQQAYNPAGVTGWQSPQVDEERRRRMLLQQQQAGPMGVQQMFPQGWGPQINNQQVPMGGIGQISAGLAENPYQGNFTQPFPTRPPWQERIPQTFNQGAAYGPFARSW